MGHRRDVQSHLLRSLALASAVLLALGTPLARVSEGRAQDREASAVRIGVAREVWAPGPPAELWAAPAAGLGIGGLTLALAVVLGQVASANHREASDPRTTQARAYDLARTVPDLSLAANVLFAVGGGIAAIGAIWLVAVPFGHHRAEAVRASIGLGGLSLEGSF